MERERRENHGELDPFLAAHYLTQREHDTLGQVEAEVVEGHPLVAPGWKFNIIKQFPKKESN